MCEATGLALVDEAGDLSDMAMLAEGTAAHVTLLVAEFLAAANKKDGAAWTLESAVARFVARVTPEYGRYWRKAAREAGAETGLAQDALARLAMLRLIRRHAGSVQALPALARFALGKSVLISKKTGPAPARSTARKTTPINLANKQTDLF